MVTFTISRADVEVGDETDGIRATISSQNLDEHMMVAKESFLHLLSTI